MTTEPGHERRRFREGIVFSLGAYTLWGLMPLYLRLVKVVGPLEFVMYRMLFSVLFVGALLTLRRQWAWLVPALRSRTILLSSLASAAVLSANWFTFVWAVSRHHIVDASLGYFINPLVSIALGAIALKEKLTRPRRIAVALAFLGALWLAIQVHQVPWIGLTLAATFGTYGLLRKIASLGALEGLALETLLLSPLSVLILIVLAGTGQSHFGVAGAGERILLVAAGPITAVPLLLFAAGARRLPLSLVGMLQYVGPTLQLLEGVLLGHEPFGARKLMGYAFIWLGFLIASVEAARTATSRNETADTVRTSAAGRA